MRWGDKEKSNSEVVGRDNMPHRIKTQVERSKMISIAEFLKTRTFDKFSEDYPGFENPGAGRHRMGL